MAKDFKIDSNGNYIIKNGDFVIDDSELQEVAEILSSHPGEFKEDPIIGAALTTFIKSNRDIDRIEQHIKKHLARDGKDYEDYKQLIKIK